MAKEISDKTNDSSKFPERLIMIGSSVYVDTDLKFKEIRSPLDLIEYLGQIKRKIDDYILDMLRK